MMEEDVKLPMSVRASLLIPTKWLVNKKSYIIGYHLGYQVILQHKAVP